MNLLSGALVPAYAGTLTNLLLAAALLRWGPRRGASVWFVAFLVADGVGLALNAIENHVFQTFDATTSSASEIEATRALLTGLDVAVGVLLVSALFLIVFATIEFLGRAPRWLAPAVLATASTAALWGILDPPAGYFLREGRLIHVVDSSYFFLTTLPAFASQGVALLVLARRPAGDPSSPTRRSHLLLGIGLLVYPLHRGAYLVVDYFLDPLSVARVTASNRFVLLGELATAVFLLFAAYLAIMRLARTHPEHAGLVLAAGVGLGSGILRALTDALPSYFYFGVANLVLPLVATYALLRHNLFGLDFRVRWAISKSTIAAVFIAVFFVASEAAQQFFGEAFQSNYVGILAAGALVFAIAPLSRLADRLAEKAVPVAAGTGPVEASASDTRGADAYRHAVRLALRDRRLTPGEEVALAHVAQGLGLTPVEAIRLRHEVEAETGKEVR
ncbi:MAG: hypothetical protein HY556_00785 [Euryarchaeota archaeon]|nr:hypothetical protein [Euryarchaeota archaeon]